MFSFAGSSHHKYAGYTLEMIVNLELESSPEYKEVFLKNWLINPSGEPGRCIEGDLHLEHINRELEEMLAHKGAEWDSDHIRKVISPNVAHFLALKNTFREGIGLSKRRGRHTAPHSKPEVRTLLRTYEEEDLHRFRSGRHYSDITEGVDTFSLGVQRLYEGKLKTWIAETT